MVSLAIATHMHTVQESLGF
jgi:hypothetical protein